MWLITFTRNAYDATEIADLFVYICDVTFEIRARAERHVIGTRGNIPNNLNMDITFFSTVKLASPQSRHYYFWCILFINSILA